MVVEVPAHQHSHPVPLVLAAGWEHHPEGTDAPLLLLPFPVRVGVEAGVPEAVLRRDVGVVAAYDADVGLPRLGTELREEALDEALRYSRGEERRSTAPPNAAM